MKTSMFMAAVVLVSAVTGGLLFTYRFQSDESAKTKDKPNFPFKVQECKDRVCVYLAPMHYHKRSLEDICLWFHRNHLSARNLDVYFFTDEARMKFFKNDSRYAFDELEEKITGGAS